MRFPYFDIRSGRIRIDYFNIYIVNYDERWRFIFENKFTDFDYVRSFRNSRQSQI